MFDDSPADDNDRPYDAVDANSAPWDDEDDTPVWVRPWWTDGRS